MSTTARSQRTYPALASPFANHHLPRKWISTTPVRSHLARLTHHHPACAPAPASFFPSCSPLSFVGVKRERREERSANVYLRVARPPERGQAKRVGFARLSARFELNTTRLSERLLFLLLSTLRNGARDVCSGSGARATMGRGLVWTYD